jgi:hypothetical protein
VLKHRKLALGAATLATLAFAGSAFAAHYSLFGDATIVPGGNPGNAAELVSDITGAGYGGVDVSPAAAIAWSSFDTLSYDFNVTDDGCGGGSPRFVLGIDTNGDNSADGYAVAHAGPSPVFTGCAPGWQSTGNLVGNNDPGRWDWSGFGGSNFSTYSAAPASVQAGSVVEAFVVIDSYWFAPASGGDNEQTVLVDNLNVDGHLTTFDPNLPASKDACKKGGWMTYERADFSTFKNQGDCIQYVNTGK